MDENFDFVIIGSGGGSMAAALLMRWAGKSVVILEKTDMFGGTTATSGGVMWIPNNRFMKQAGLGESAEKAMTYLDSVVGDSKDEPGASPARRRAYVSQAPEMLEFLISQGVKFRRIPSWPDYYDVPGASLPGRTVMAQLYDINRLGEWKDLLRPFALPLPVHLDDAMLHLPNLKRSWKARGKVAQMVARAVLGKLTGKALRTGGNALQGQVLEAALKAGVEIRLNSPVSSIVIEDGRAVGVVIEKDGADHRIGGKLGVLINAGGFTRNQAMLDTFIPGVSSEWTNASPGDTGEMIQEGIRLGAAIAQMDARIGSQNTLPPGAQGMRPTMQGDVCKPHTIVVDQTGVRFMNETGTYTEFVNAMIARNKKKKTPAVPSWMILDSQYADTYMLAGTMPGSKKPDHWYESKFLHRGETIEELAQSLDMDPATLRATVDRYNGFVRNGHDEDFHRGDTPYQQWLGDQLHKPSTTLGTLEKGPFYALPIYPGDVSTYGGLVTDEHARVLRTDGTPIDGLYATGTSTASVMGRKSVGAGASVGPSFTWGYVAAKHAANLHNSAKGAARAAG